MTGAKQTGEGGPRWTASLPCHGRFSYSGIRARPAWSWPGGKRLAVYVGLNLEHFAFGDGLGATLAPASPQPDVLNAGWREYGNRVGGWRCLELLDELRLPAAVILNTALYDHCPELVRAFADRGDELVGHGHTNAERQGLWSEAAEARLLASCRDTILERSGQRVRGWLSPWISESFATPDLLEEAGYGYTLNWCHDDQPTRLRTRSARGLWSIPYPQELNDIPAIMVRQMDAPAFADMVIDSFTEMLQQCARQPLVMGVALHPYIVGQPHRLLHLRRALRVLADPAHSDSVWMTTPGAIHDCMEELRGLPGQGVAA